MQASITRLYPDPGNEQPLEGLYLEHNLHTRGGPGRPFIYSNFITTLDGRIAVAAAGRDTHIVPGATANQRDWRLYQELAGQADLLVTSGRFFRQTLAGEAQDRLPVGSEAAYADIRDWRIEQGLSPQPDVAILSASLDIPLAALEPYRERKLIVITGEAADQQRIADFRDNNIEVICAGPGNQVDGRAMVTALAKQNYKSIYSISGPAVFHTLLATGAVDRLYLTITQQLLGGEAYDTLTRGALLDPVRGMQLVQLSHDPHSPAGAGQMFCVFEPGVSQTS
jgi:riboflavin biosynthesis pyrimidine reductase